MSTYDSRLAALEKGVTVMKQDIIYKLDETNTALTIFQGVLAVHGRDIKSLTTQIKGIEVQIKGIEIRLDRSEIQLEGLTQEVRTIKEQQNVQGRDIKDIKNRLDGMDQRFISLEEKFDRRFDQVLQAIANLTNKP